jgi:integrase
MKVYKVRYRDRNGQIQKSAKFYVDVFDHNRLRHRIPAFEDRRLSEGLERNIEALVNCVSAGLEPDSKLNQWIEAMPENLLRKLVSWGLMTGQRAEITKPLIEHIDNYATVLEAKGFSKDYIVRTKNRLKKIVKDCRFYFFRDITKSAVEIYSGKLKADKYSNTSRGHYLDCLKTFLNWAEQDQRISTNPIAKLDKPARDSKKKGVLTPEQFIRLIKTTFAKNIIIENTTGQERAVLYMLAGTTGLRRNELLSLTWDCINLSGDNAFVRVKASIAKNGKEALQPIPPAMVAILQALKAHTRPNGTERVFVSFSKWINTAELITSDLEAAEIELKDKDGNEICFHSLRNSYISFLANSATPAKVVQTLARHSDPRLTFNTYARTFAEAEQKAISYLPNFGNFVLDTSLDRNRIKAGTFINNHRHKNGQDALNNAVLAVNQIPPRGVEPLSPG